MHIAGGSVFLLQGRRKIFQGGAGQGREQNPLGMAGQQSNSGHFQGGAGQAEAAILPGGGACSRASLILTL